ncbi:MAG: glycosyltransferase family 2 protein [Planctomycetota bacterium]
MTIRALTALPVFNEARSVSRVLDEVCRFSSDVLVVDDGSSDGTADILSQRKDVRVETHVKNQGYGAALRTAFQYALQHQYDVLVTIDCDGQHEPQLIPDFVQACRDVDMVSGSRYLKRFPGDSQPPAERRRVNETVTALVNERLGYSLTDGFCGFKAYRVAALQQLNITETGYAMPLEVWVQAACLGWRIVEFPVPLVYLDLTRSFGGSLDDADRRLAHYFQVFERCLAAARAAGLPAPRAAGNDRA